ncbi:Uncharacterized protein HZ326_18079 [Fusarium oxysporum f. sp. albedinis]|nr:Uncharacterized protein HZ326_18079 [Fusarium oxysporum f. sp. albedinis]
MLIQVDPGRQVCFLSGAWFSRLRGFRFCTRNLPGKQGQVAELGMDRTVTSSQLECKCSWVVFGSSTSSILVHTCHWMPSISTIHSGRWLLKHLCEFISRLSTVVCQLHAP